MKIIQNTELFKKLEKTHDNDGYLWTALFKDEETIEDERIPIFFGGLDYITTTKTKFEFHDIGCNGKDNSFVIVAEDVPNK